MPTDLDPEAPPVSTHQQALDRFTLCVEAFRDQRDRSVKLNDMTAHEQRGVFYQAALDGLTTDGLTGMRDRLLALLLTLKNQQQGATTRTKGARRAKRR